MRSKILIFQGMMRQKWQVNRGKGNRMILKIIIDAWRKIHRFVNTNQNSPNITYLYPLPMDQSFLGIAFPNSQNMNQNTSVTTYFNPFLLNMNQNPLDINYSDNRGHGLGGAG
ncbi:9364_t:CDS:2 [Diversispora eburnea]|uniref:9364_t:CDS:1 n=1 Tax=Diversispora eburnea TaxID=1213867 RepID=A0A9N8WIW9_9GLOM|nr:9364_t:CDS:2 [Diversispora eburnea]